MTLWLCQVCQPERICTVRSTLPGAPDTCTHGGDGIADGVCDWQEFRPLGLDMHGAFAPVVKGA
jgi:hypothetical protein